MDETIRRIETLSDPGSFFGWMCGIMSNQYGKLNRRKIDGKISYTDQLPEMEDESAGVDDVVQAVDGKILHEAIERLPPKLKEAVLLRYFADMSISQIARFLMIPVGTVNSRLHIARTVLGMRLGANLKKPAVALIAAAMFLLLGATAAVVGLRGTKTANQDELVNQDAAAESVTSDTSVTSESPESPSQVSPVQQVTQVPQLTPKGEEAMTGKKTAAAALTAALAASAPLGAATGDEHQFINPTTYPATAGLPPAATAGAYDEMTIAIVETRPCDFNCRTPDNPGGWIETRPCDEDEGIASHIDTSSERGTLLVIQ